MHRLLPYVGLAFLMYVLLIYLQTYHSDDVKDWVIRMDVLDITDMSKLEHYREDRIKRLEGLDADQKLALINHTVFIGATARMVELALGSPNAHIPPIVKKNLLFYIYLLANDKRPTVFEFKCTSQNIAECTIGEQNDGYKDVFTLSQAYKKSAIDVDTLSSEENR